MSRGPKGFLQGSLRGLLRGPQGHFSQKTFPHPDFSHVKTEDGVHDGEFSLSTVLWELSGRPPL